MTINHTFRLLKGQDLYSILGLSVTLLPGMMMGDFHVITDVVHSISALCRRQRRPLKHRVVQKTTKDTVSQLSVAGHIYIHISYVYLALFLSTDFSNYLISFLVIDLY